MISPPPDSTAKSGRIGDLLADFARNGNEEAFAGLVRHYAGLVYHAARRRAGEDGLAEEVAQSTFALLARKAPGLTTHPCLAAWLHRTATWLAGDAANRESAHRRRLKRYAETAALHAAGEDPLASALPHLDSALESLRESDRQLILMRFHEGLSFRMISDRLGQPQEATRKATQRALGRLGTALRRSGVVLSTTILTAGLPLALTPSAPAAFLARLPARSLATAGSVGGKTILFHSLQTMTATKQIAAAAALVALFAVPALGLQEFQRRASQGPYAMSGTSLETAAGLDGESSAKSAPGEPARIAGAPEDVLILLRGVSSAKDPFRAAALAAEALENVDPSLIGACLEAVKSIKNEMLAACLNIALFQRWTNVDPGSAMIAAQESRSLEFPVVVRTVFGTWMQKDPAAAVTWLKDASAKEQRRVFQEATDSIQSVDSAALAEVVGKWHPQEQNLWSQEGFGEPLKTMDIALHLPPGGIRQNLMRSAMFSLGSDPAPVIDWCLSHLEGDERVSTLNSALSAWSSRDPEAALEWYLHQPPGTVSAAALASSEKLADDDFYAEFRKRLSGPDRASLDLYRATSMAGEKAAPWILSLPEGPERTALFDTVAANWVSKQPAEASAWVDSLAPGPERDSAASGLTRVIRNTDVFSAITWAESIGDEKLRSQCLTGIWEGWRARDGVAAERWLREANVSSVSRAVIEKANAARSNN